MKAAACGVALLCAVALAAPGCGGDDEASESFRNDYNAVVRTYASLPGEVSAAVSEAGDKSARELERQFSRLADRLDAEVRALRRLDPPDDAREEFKAFVDALAKVGDDLRRISSGAAENSSRQVSDAARNLVEDSKAVSRAEDRLKNAVE
jgi:hypothetical protein